MKFEAQKTTRLDKRRNIVTDLTLFLILKDFLGIYDVGQAEFGFNFSINVDVLESNQVDFRCTDKAEDLLTHDLREWNIPESVQFPKFNGSNLQSQTGITVFFVVVVLFVLVAEILFLVI